MTSDYWIGTLTCPYCGTHHPEDTVFIQTRIQDERQASALRIGQRIDFDPVDVNPAHYLRLRTPPPVGDVRILEAWDCTTCAALRWAAVTLRDRVFVALEAVALTVEQLDRDQLISTAELGNVFHAWTGVTLFPDDDWSKPPRPDWNELLRAFLAEHPQ